MPEPGGGETRCAVARRRDQWHAGIIEASTRWADSGSGRCSRWTREGIDCCRRWAQEGSHRPGEMAPPSWFFIGMAVAVAWYQVLGSVPQAWYWLARRACFTTEEIRQGCARVGFALETLAGRRAVLAHIDFPGPPRVGRYGVDLGVMERLALPLLNAAAQGAEQPGRLLVLIDELGRMGPAPPSETPSGPCSRPRPTSSPRFTRTATRSPTRSRSTRTSNSSTSPEPPPRSTTSAARPRPRPSCPCCWRHGRKATRLPATSWTAYSGWAPPPHLPFHGSTPNSPSPAEAAASSGASRTTRHCNAPAGPPSTRQPEGDTATTGDPRRRRRPASLARPAAIGAVAAPLAHDSHQALELPPRRPVNDSTHTCRRRGSATAAGPPIRPRTSAAS